MEKPALDAHYLSLRFDAVDSMTDAGEPVVYLQRRTGHFTVWNGEQIEDTEQDIRIGDFAIVYVDLDGACVEDVHAFDVFDTEGATIEYYEDLYLDDAGRIKDCVVDLATTDGLVWSSNVLIIERLILQPQFRGQDLGLAAMRGLILCARGGAGLVLIKPFPLQFEGGYDPKAEEFVRQGYASLPKDHRLSTAKLCRHYARLGFKRVPKTPFMVRDAQLKLPTVSELLNPRRRQPRLRK